MPAPDHLVPFQFKKDDPDRPKPELAASGNYRKLQRMLAGIFDDPKYWESLKARALAGRLPPAVEVEMMRYYAGKVRDTLDVHVNDHATAIAGIAPDEAIARHHALTEKFRELTAAQTAANASKPDVERDALGIAWGDVPKGSKPS